MIRWASCFCWRSSSWPHNWFTSSSSFSSTTVERWSPSSSCLPSARTGPSTAQVPAGKRRLIGWLDLEEAPPRLLCWASGRTAMQRAAGVYWYWMNSKPRRGLVGCSTSWRFSSWHCGGPTWLPATGGCLQGAPLSLEATWQQPCGWALPRLGSILSSASSLTESFGVASAPHSSTAENPGYQGNPTVLYEGFTVGFFLIYVSIALIDLDLGLLPLYSVLSLSISLLFILQFPPVPPSPGPSLQRLKVDCQSRGCAGAIESKSYHTRRLKGMGITQGEWITSCVYVLVNRHCGRPCQCRDAKSWKKKRERERFDKTVKTRRLAWDILKTRYSVRCEIRKYEKKKKKNNNTKQRNDTSQGITGNVLHFKSCTKKKM